jgi:trans-aconitate methyltransferase
MVTQNQTKLYKELAHWWPVLSSPADYTEEASFYRETLTSFALEPPITLLELGCGGGNNASHLKEHFNMVLVDLSPEMLEVSRSLNPECEHIQGDMRTIRLGKHFDAVFIHDAVGYMTTKQDLRDAITTAYVHCAPGGVALFAPDFVYEKFQPSTKQGGHDLGKRSLRYLAWTWDPDPNDTTYFTDFVYLLREGSQDVRCVYDRHILGLFSRDDWLQWLRAAGFQAQVVPFKHSAVNVIGEVFVGIKSTNDTS